MNEKEHKGKQRIESTIAQWAMQDTVLFGIACMIDKEPSKTYKTIGINVSRGTVPAIKFNPDWVDSVNDEVLEAVLVQETFKILLKHVTSRYLDPRDISKLASQITTTQLLNKTSMNEDLSKYAFNPSDFGLEDDRFYEEYQNKLMDQSSQLKDKVSKKLEMDPQRLQKQDQDEDDDSDEGSSQGSGGGEGQGNGQFQNQDDAIKEYMNPFNGDAKGWGQNEVFDSEVKDFIDKNKSSSRKWGKYTSNYVEMIVAAHEPKISYKEILRRFATSVIKTAQFQTRMKINRRYGLKSPGHTRKSVSKVIFAIDSSGSMGTEKLQLGLASMNSICKHSEVEYVVFDTEIKQTGDFKKAKNEFEVHGRGGTDFNAICDYAAEKRVDGLVIFTDGWAPAPNNRPPCKVLWLLTEKDEKPPVDWGFVAYLDSAS